MSNNDFMKKSNEIQPDLKADPSERAYEAYSKIIHRGRENYARMAAQGMAGKYTITEEDQEFVRNTCKDLTPGELLATTMGLTAYKNFLESGQNPKDLFKSFSQTRH